MKFTDSVKDYWLRHQIQTHLKIMVCFNNYYRKSPAYSGIGELAIPLFTASIIKSRMFLEFMGIRYDSKNNKLKQELQNQFKKDDISIVDLGGTFAKLSDIKEDQKQLLLHVFFISNKYIAHLTHPEDKYITDHSIIQAIDLIMGLINNNLFRNSRNRWVMDEKRIWKQYSPYKLTRVS